MSKSKKTKSRRRWIIIGPGIIIALILALQIGIRNHQKVSMPPIIERQVIGLKASKDAISAPEIGYVLKHAEHLKLSDKQMASLKKLQAEWEAKSKPLTDEMDNAADEFRQFMKKAGNKATIQDIQSHASRVSELSRQISSLRRIYWEKSLQVLNREQIKKIQQEVAQEIHNKTLSKQEETR